MKHFLLKAVLTCSIVGGTAIVWGATTTATIDHFALIGPDTAKVGEAIDVTVEARDKDDKVIPTYHGQFYFQSTDLSATLPSQGKVIQMAESDNGVKKLSKGVIFKKVGDQTLTVSEVVADAFGKKTIRIETADAGVSTGSSDAITIVSPQNNDILDATKPVMISGYGKKNSKVNIKLNNVVVGTVVTDDSGFYTKTLSALTQESNIAIVEQLDGSNAVTGNTQVKFSVKNNAPNFTSIVVSPSTTVEASTGITLTVVADAGLTEVTGTIDGSLITLKEGKAGEYTATTVAPAKPGTYPIAINLKNNLSQITTKLGIAVLEVTEKIAPPAPKFTNVKISTEGTRVVFTFGVENPPANLTKFKIAYGESADSLSEQVVTKDAKDIKTASGETYTWYIDKLEPKKYTFRIFGMKEDQSLIADFASEALSTTVGTPGCTIGNVGDITVKTTSDKSVLSWLSVSGAVSYNIYKLSVSGEPQFIQNTKDTSYILFLSSGSVVHEDFGIKALCDDKTESADMAKASKVQTGPGMIAILVIISALAGVVIMRRKTSY